MNTVRRSSCIPTKNDALSLVLRSTLHFPSFLHPMATANVWRDVSSDSQLSWVALVCHASLCGRVSRWNVLTLPDVVKASRMFTISPHCGGQSTECSLADLSSPSCGPGGEAIRRGSPRCLRQGKLTA